MTVEQRSVTKTNIFHGGIERLSDSWSPSHMRMDTMEQKLPVGEMAAFAGVNLATPPRLLAAPPLPPRRCWGRVRAPAPGEPGSRSMRFFSYACDCGPALSALALVFFPAEAKAGRHPSLSPGHLHLTWQIGGRPGASALLEDGSGALKSAPVG